MALQFIYGLDSFIETNMAIKSDYFNYSAMTEGEFKLHLLAGQLRTLQQAHPDDEFYSLWRTGENYLLDAIYKGLHSTSGCIMPTGYVDKSLYPVLEHIKRASNRFQSATKKGMWMIDRSSQSFGINPLDQLEPFYTGGINGYPYRDGCNIKYCNSNDNPCTNSTTTGIDKECEKFEGIKEILNTYLEDSSHHILYNFASDTQALAFKPTSNWKVGQHILTVAEMAKISGVSVANMTEWVQLGIMRHNAKRGAGALNANDSIDTLLQNPDFLLENAEQYRNQYGIYGIGAIPVAAYIIVACAIAIMAITGLVQAINKQEPTALDRIRGLATALFSPTGADFPTRTGGGGNNCPTGYYWDTLLNKCMPNATGGGGTTCPTGYKWDATQLKCVVNSPTTTDNSNMGLIIAAVIGGGLLLSNNNK